MKNNISEVQKLQKIAGIISETSMMKGVKDKSFNFGKIKSISNLKSAVEHLYPSAKIMHVNDDTNNYLGVNPSIGYLYVEGAGRGFLILTYDKSQHTEDMVGIVWINGDKNRGFEFSTIQELEKIVSKYKNKIGL